MKIAIVGCGALGSFYGAKLCRLGEEVHFLLRSDYDAVRRNGVSIRSVDGDFHVQPGCARLPAEIGVCDAVFIGLKTTANSQFPTLLPALAGPRTAIVTLQNGLGNEEQLARLFPAEQILGGRCFVCLNRLEPGVIEHTAYGKILLGEFERPPQPRARELAALFRRAAVACDVTDNLARTNWEKLVWNIPFNGLGVAGVAGYDLWRGDGRRTGFQFQELHKTGKAALRRDTAPPVLTTDLLLADPRWEKLVRELMLEVIAAASARGLEIPQSRADEQIERTRIMSAYKASTLIDFERGQPLEVESMFLEPLRQARAAGVPTPWLALLCRVLERLDPVGK